MKFSFVLDPPQEVCQLAYKISHEIAARHETYFALGECGNLPRIPVYSGDCGSEGFGALFRTGAMLTSKTKPLTCSFSKLVVWQGYILAEFKRAGGLVGFYDRTKRKIEGLQSTGINVRAVDIEWANTTKQWRPRLVLSCLKDEGAAREALAEIEWTKQRFKIKAASICESGHYGLCLGRKAKFENMVFE